MTPILPARFLQMVRRAALRLAPLVAFASLPAAAQYQPAGSGVEQPQERKGELQRAVADARFRLGPFRVAPWAGLRNISYQKDLLSSEKGDLTATAGAGARLYLPLGARAVIATHALPEYVYWHRERDRRQIVGHYGAGLFVFLNRLEFEATARRAKDLELVSDELLVRVPQTADIYELAGQLRLAGSIALFAGVRENQHRFEPFEDQDLPGLASALGRDHRVSRAGLRYLLPASRGHFGLGATVEETTFLDDAVGSDNEGQGLYGEINLRGNRLDLFFDGSRRRLEAIDDSGFPDVRLTTGQVAVQLRLGWRLTPNVYFRRSLSYPLTDASPFVVDDRLGVRLGIAVRVIRELNLQVFYEVGELDFAESGRLDEVTAYGAATAVPIHRVIQLNIGYRKTEYTSNMSGFDRGFEELFANFQAGFGGGGREW